MLNKTILKNNIESAMTDAFERALLTITDADGESKSFTARQVAGNFAKICAEALSEAIDDYIRSAQITITPAGLSAPNGPVSGVAVLNNAIN